MILSKIATDASTGFVFTVSVYQHDPYPYILSPEVLLCRALYMHTCDTDWFTSSSDGSMPTGGVGEEGGWMQGVCVEQGALQLRNGPQAACVGWGLWEGVGEKEGGG